MKFILKKASNRQLRFNLAASNGQAAATSETYDQGVPGLGPIAAQDHRLREVVLTDPDRNRIGIPIVV